MILIWQQEPRHQGRFGGRLKRRVEDAGPVVQFLLEAESVGNAPRV